MKKTEERLRRCLWIYHHLINYDTLTTTYLADKFGVTTKTIQRDLIVLSDIIPIYTERKAAKIYIHILRG